MAHERLRPQFLFDEEKIKQLKQLAPECFEDGKINFETLRQNLGDWVQDEEDKDLEHFGLFWPGKRDARRIAALPPQGTLEPVYGEGLKADGTPDTDGVNDSKNIFIEGENLEVLKILQKSYAGKIKMIYIDPPYNTGNDFVYDDDFTEPLQEYLRRTGQVDEEGKPLTTNKRSDGRFHSKWLSMMYPRLKLARNLLRDDGVILIHIDENEYSNLLCLVNEIFGEENNIGTIVWDKKNPKGDAKGIASQNELIICFGKDKWEVFEQNPIVRDKKNAQKILAKAKTLFSTLGKVDYPDDIKRLAKKYKLEIALFEHLKKPIDLESINKEFADWIKNQKDLSGGEMAYSEIDEEGKVFQRVSMVWPNKKSAPDDYYYELVHPITKKPCQVPEKGWRFPTKTLKQMLEAGKIVFGEDETTQPRNKYLLEENLTENIPSVIPFGGSDEKLFKEYKLSFDNPKPYQFATELIKYFTSESDLILDFFAGSGTSAHAVFEANSIDGSHRQFILVQLDEPIDEKDQAYKHGYRKISDISRKRIQLAGRGYENQDDLGYRLENEIQIISNERYFECLIPIPSE